MKKIISLLVVVMIILSTASALGETAKMDGDFSIRNGIEFGMTVDEVRNIEENISGNTLYESKNVKSDILGNTFRLYYEEKSIAGIPCSGTGGNVLYYFDDENLLLESISYWFGYYNTNQAMEYYSSIYEMMSAKYGVPMINEKDGVLFTVLTPAFENFLSIAQKIGLKHYAYSQWIMEYDDYCVLIDTVMYGHGDKPGIEVGYRIISDEEASKAIADAVKAVNDSIEKRYNDF